MSDLAPDAEQFGQTELELRCDDSIFDKNCEEQDLLEVTCQEANLDEITTTNSNVKVTSV